MCVSTNSYFLCLNNKRNQQWEQEYQFIITGNYCKDKNNKEKIEVFLVTEHSFDPLTSFNVISTRLGSLDKTSLTWTSIWKTEILIMIKSQWKDGFVGYIDLFKNKQKMQRQ